MISSPDLWDIIWCVIVFSPSCDLQPLAVTWRNIDARDLTRCLKHPPPPLVTHIWVHNEILLTFRRNSFRFWSHMPAQNIYYWSNHSTIHQTTKTQLFLFQKDKHICVCFPATSNSITWQITRIEPIPLLVFFPSGLIECEQLLLCSTLMIIVCSCVTNKQTQNYLNKQINNLNNWVWELVIMFHIDDDSARLCALIGLNLLKILIREN